MNACAKRAEHNPRLLLVVDRTYAVSEVSLWFLLWILVYCYAVSNVFFVYSSVLLCGATHMDSGYNFPLAWRRVLREVQLF